MNKNTPLFIAIFLLIILINSIFAQEVQVKNVSFVQQNDVIIISYDLIGNFNKNFSVSLSLSNDNGRTYRIVPKSVHGDIGKNVTPGLQKRIIWSFMQDFPGGLQGDEFVFAVEAELRNNSSKLPFYLLGVGAIGAAGAAVYFITNGDEKSETPSTHGSINMIIPGEVN
ncbi:MAG TPA: hypothetical protein PLP19_13940 [bacterium]|nr:hypothetical protein [bacterium]HPN44589.1 hypothetical protein [bacterium]